VIQITTTDDAAHSSLPARIVTMGHSVQRINGLIAALRRTPTTKVEPTSETDRGMLTAIKLLHTTVWALLAGCILALPITGLKRRFDWAVILTVIIAAECGVLALNAGRCPLTDLAARFTAERTDNFDIYLPIWLARYNKPIFGSLFVINEVIVLNCRSKKERRLTHTSQKEAASLSSTF
jgi:hypothetical protein